MPGQTLHNLVCWVRAVKRRSRNSSREFHTQSARRLSLEPLEDRRMLATITVTSLADNLNIDGQITLREAVRAAEMNISVDGSTAGSAAQRDTIQFAAGLSGAINLAIVGDSVAGPSAFSISSQITIRGNANGITIQRSAAAPDMRLFRVAAAGSLRLESITLTGGVARGTNGAAPGESGGDGRGGAIFNTGALEIIASTLHNNQAIGGNAGAGGVAGGGRGGAIYNEAGNLSIINATLSGNSVLMGSGVTPGSTIGGGVYSVNGSTTIHNSTITNNTAGGPRGVFVVGINGTATLNLFSTIIGQALNPGGFELNATIDTDGELVVNGGNNLVRAQNDFHAITVSTADPLLGTLANNGGPTLTHALLSGSPAINEGGNPSALANDQRGSAFARVVGARADIGAVELQTVAGPALPGDYNDDGAVDAADYVAWRRTMGAHVTEHSGADGSGDGTINPADYTVWRENFGETSSGTGAAVFELLEVASALAAPVMLANEASPGDDSAPLRQAAFTPRIEAQSDRLLRKHTTVVNNLPAPSAAAILAAETVNDEALLLWLNDGELPENSAMHPMKQETAEDFDSALSAASCSFLLPLQLDFLQ